MFSSVAEVYEDVPVEDENSSYWKNDYELWDNSTAVHEEQDLWENDIQSNLTSWKVSHEDEIFYDIYNRQPEEEEEEIDEDGVELSDDWLVLDFEEPNENDRMMVKHTEISIDHVQIDNSISDEEKSIDVLDCEDETPKSIKRKISNPKPRDEEFYFKHKKYSKKTHKGKPSHQKKSNWKKNCCIRGKKVGNTRRTFLAKDLFQECQERTRNLSSRMSRPCRWIFLSCCEARALRRYYIHHKPKESNIC
ncbi:hypothetical protein HNY73_005065 [Argiope bruennichi]|uniref:Uncharacterized protein n=2 Tax=Argiope bruennichi TaxID=94029 RepID=A0A8T0FFB5_ARGBR|nr:hypothetical protein HNY73_005065 [Argiope bruennichi]